MAPQRTLGLRQRSWTRPSWDRNLGRCRAGFWAGSPVCSTRKTEAPRKFYPEHNKEFPGCSGRLASPREEAAIILPPSHSHQQPEASGDPRVGRLFRGEQL